MLEVEQKFALVEPARTRALLDQLGIVWLAPLEQVDVYLNHPVHDYAQTDEALRIRRIGEQNWITYKGPKLSTTTKTRRELELPLAAGSNNSEQYIELLVALGFRPVREIHKHRQPGELSFQDTVIQIAWDQVTGLGNYLELELCVEPSEVAQAQQTILALSAALNLTVPERRSYLELLEMADTAS